MSKIKGWRKTRSDKYRQVWLHKSNKLAVSVEKNDTRDPTVVYYGNRNDARAKDFKTKKQALKFAKQYMKKHPRG